MDYGTHCAYCGQLDFLPFNCGKCGKVVCAEHRTDHDCIKEVVLPIPDDMPKSKPRAKPQWKIQQKAPEAPPSTQPRPDGGVRLGSQPGAAKSERAAAAFERLKLLVAGTGRSNPSPKGARAPARAAVSPVAPAELKKTATGDPLVKFADRVYFRVQRPAVAYKDPLTGSSGTRPAKTVPLYFDKAATVGQVLDKAAKQLGVSARGATLKRMNGSALDLNSPIIEVPQGATLIMAL